jgi:hypothetical protein
VIVRDIRQASQATDIDFNYLMAQAQTESGMRPDAAAPSSSARGLYQFIDSTWLDMVRRYGARYGAGSAASAIDVDSRGRSYVADPGVRKQILALRDDPALSSSLAAEYARCNKETLESALGRPATSTDLYLAHFLGAGGATSFLKCMQRNSRAPAASVLPAAAAANPSVFYNRRTGAPRTVSQIYRNFADRIEHPEDAFSAVMEASAPAAAPTAMMPLASAEPARMMPLYRPSGPMPLVAMLNSMAKTAMRAIGGKEKMLETGPGQPAITVAPNGPAAHARRPANQIA